MQTERIKLRKFHPKQKELWRSVQEHKRLLWRCGRRFGKTTLLEDSACHWAINGERIGWFCPNYKLLLPSYKLILRTLRPIVAHASKVDAIIETVTGGQVEFWTLGDEDAGRSRWYNKAIIDEAGLVKKGLKDIFQQAIEPTLLDRDGTAIMAGTPKGIDPDNFFYEAHSDPSLGWHESHMPSSANPMLPAHVLADLERTTPALVFQQEYRAEFVDWRGAAFFTIDKLLSNGEALPYWTKCDGVFAIMDTAVKTGKKNDGTAVTWFGINKIATNTLMVLDWDIVQIEGSLLENWLPSINMRSEQLAGLTGARAGNLGTWIEDKSSGMILLQQAQRRGMDAKAIQSDLTSMGKDERAISVSGYVHTDKIKLSVYAYDKVKEYKGQSRNHFISQVCGYKIGVEDQADDLLDTFCYGVAIALGDYRGF